MNIVPRINTPLSQSATKAALEEALGDESIAATVDIVALLAALIWIETGAGRSCQNFNVGNITASASFPGNAWRPPWFESDPEASPRNRDLHEKMLRGQAPSAFRAYGELDEGMRDFVHRVKVDFPEVLASAATGDPDAFRIALSRKYSHDYANIEATRTLASVMKDFGGSPKAPRAAGSASSPPESDSGSFSATLPVLRHGAEGNAVELWCTLVGLERRTRMGAAVVARTIAWQSERGLKPDAIVGPKSWEAAMGVAARGAG